jgi:NitT/TauT family transport system ATP-binding protein
MDARIVTEQLSKTYTSVHGESVRALDPVTIDLESNSFVALVGRSGCGKSTLLRLIAGLEAPTSGSATVAGAQVAGPPDSVRYVFQNYGESLLPWRTVGENVLFGLRHGYRTPEKLGKAAEKRLIQQYLDEVGLPDTADRYPGELSGGMQQRVAIARALAASPKVLLLDEPFSAVDALSRANLQDLILRIWKEHDLTVLFVTHDIDEALYLADRVIVLKAGGGGIERDVTVTVPRPRDQVSSREAPQYLALRRDVLNLVLA